MTKKTLATLAALPLLAFGLDAGGTIGVSPGFRFESTKITATDSGDANASITEKAKKMNSFTADIYGRVTLDSFYIRANGGFGWIITTPQYVITDNSVESTPTDMNKRHAYYATGALGYTFTLGNSKEFTLAPEVGFSLQSVSPDIGAVERAGTPFVGVQFGWDFAADWNFNLGVDFHFYGMRKSTFVTPSRNSLNSTTKGHYMGPEAKLGVNYAFADGWDAGIAYNFKYLVTNKETVGTLVGMKQTWWVNQATLNIGYSF